MSGLLAKFDAGTEKKARPRTVAGCCEPRLQFEPVVAPDPGRIRGGIRGRGFGSSIAGGPRGGFHQLLLLQAAASVRHESPPGLHRRAQRRLVAPARVDDLLVVAHAAAVREELAARRAQEEPRLPPFREGSPGEKAEGAVGSLWAGRAGGRGFLCFREATGARESGVRGRKETPGEGQRKLQSHHPGVGDEGGERGGRDGGEDVLRQRRRGGVLPVAEAPFCVEEGRGMNV